MGHLYAFLPDHGKVLVDHADDLVHVILPHRHAPHTCRFGTNKGPKKDKRQERRRRIEERGRTTKRRSTKDERRRARDEGDKTRHEGSRAKDQRRRKEGEGRNDEKRRTKDEIRRRSDERQRVDEAGAESGGAFHAGVSLFSQKNEHLKPDPPAR